MRIVRLKTLQMVTNKMTKLVNRRMQTRRMTQIKIKNKMVVIVTLLTWMISKEVTRR